MAAIVAIALCGSGAALLTRTAGTAGTEPAVAARAAEARRASASTPPRRAAGAAGASSTAPAGTTGPVAGERVLVAAWGSRPGEFGRRAADEANPEGPMSLVPTREGFAVLDQVNGRVQRFDRAGRLLGEIAIGPDTAQDLLVDDTGRVAVLDRLGQAELTLVGADGRPLASVPVPGGPIAEGGEITGLFHGPGGYYLEREHGETVRVAGSDGAADPDRPTQPGRPTRDGRLFLSAILVDPAGGRAIVRAFDHDGQVVWQRSVLFAAPVLHLVLLDSDRLGHVVLAALIADESPEGDPVDPVLAVARLDQGTGGAAGALTLPAPSEADEVFKELAVTDDGELLHMRVTPEGLVVTRYRFASSDT
jgi:hypothetical protein